MRKPRVNIFDDEVSILRFLREVISLRDFEVVTFDRPVVCPLYGAQADKCLNPKPCADIIMTDYKMPKMTGIEMLHLQAQRGCRVDVRNKAIMSGDPNNKQKMIEGVAGAFFQKPFNLHELFVWLDTCKERIDLSNPVRPLRRTNRHHVDTDIVYAHSTDKKVYEGTLMNVSDNGICLKINAPLMEGQSIMIKTELPNGCKNASVRWLKKMGDRSYMAGFSCC
jgi:DNA-binding NtrC family response regulator